MINLVARRAKGTTTVTHRRSPPTDNREGAAGRSPCLLLSVLLASVVILLVAFPPGIARADTTTWSRPIEVSAGVGGWFPTVAADDAGNVHVVWQAGFPQQTKFYVSALYYTHWDGQNWSQPTDVALIWADHALRSALAVDGAGALHLLYKGFGQLDPAALGGQGSLGQEDIWYTTVPGATASSVQTWRTPQRLTKGTTGYYSDIAIDSHGVLHAIWTESLQGTYGIYYAHSADGGVTWSGRIPLDDADPVWWYRAHLKIDGQDRLHVVWEDLNPAISSGSFGTTVMARYALSTDGGQSWTKTTFESKTGEYPSGIPFDAGPQQPSIGVDGRGGILLVYRNPTSNQILFRRSTDGIRWSESESIPGVREGVERPYDIYDMVTDSAGHVHLAMVGYPTGSSVMSLLHSEWDGKAWSEPSVIVASPPYPEYPKLALSNGNQLHVVWFNGDRPSVDRNQIGIWYSTASTTAPRTTGRPSPPVVAAPTKPSTVATPRANDSTRQAVPAELGNTSPWATSLTDPPLLAVATGVVPVVMLLGLVVAIRAGLLGRVAAAFGRRN